MDYIQCRKILRAYFSDITYIDNEFNIELLEAGEDIISDDEIPVDVPLDIMPEQKYVSDKDNSDELAEENSEQVENNQKNESADALMEILKRLSQPQFSTIKLIPIAFDNSTTDQLIIEKMTKAHLTVIDWDLGHGRKALPIIKSMLEEVTQLKVIVVYTNGFQEARKSAGELFLDMKCIKDESRITCFQYRNKSLIFIVDRTYLNIINILDEVENIFILENGIMPIAVLDIADRIHEKSGDIFGAFCKPFEDVYFLQMFYSAVQDNELTNYLSDFVIRKIYSDIHIDKALGSELLQYKKDSLIRVLESDEFEYTLEKCIEQLQSHALDEGREFVELQKRLDAEIYKTIARNLKGKQIVAWSEIVKGFKPLFKILKNSYVDEKVKKLFGDNQLEIKEKFKDIYKRYINEVEKKAELELNNYKKNILPVLLQMLISKEQFLRCLPELIDNIKLHKYENIDLEECIGNGIHLMGYQKSNFLMNKIHFGDILCDSKKNEYLLCITPPCDSFRPQKVDFEYTFIRGQLIDADEVSGIRKESIHITTYPVIEQSNKNERVVKYIKWKMYDIVTFNLDDKAQYENICGYKRYYRLDEIYTRQIANKFISHFSRAGVDEIFVKGEKNLLALFS